MCYIDSASEIVFGARIFLTSSKGWFQWKCNIVIPKVTKLTQKKNIKIQASEHMGKGLSH